MIWFLTCYLRLNLHRSFKADNNQLQDIPYDFSLLLQKYDHNAITLGSNPWLCTCNAEITDTVSCSLYSLFSAVKAAQGIQMFVCQSIRINKHWELFNQPNNHQTWWLASEYTKRNQIHWLCDQLISNFLEPPREDTGFVFHSLFRGICPRLNCWTPGNCDIKFLS